jgi:hypothetical protein
MSRVVQEKFEVRPAQNPNDDGKNGWASDASARDHLGMQTRAKNGRYEPYTGDGYNCLPPGSDISNQEVAYTRTPVEAADMGTGTQATTDVTPQSLESGFDRKDMRPTDDMYTREHNDAFYDTVEVDGVEGFVERNNYLDRL